MAENALEALRETLNDALEKAGQTQKEFIDAVGAAGMSRMSIYRRWRVAPWERSRRRWTELELFQKISEGINVPAELLMWLGGFNPFATKGLTADELRLLYTLVKRAASDILKGKFEASGFKDILVSIEAVAASRAK